MAKSHAGDVPIIPIKAQTISAALLTCLYIISQYYLKRFGIIQAPFASSYCGKTFYIFSTAWMWIWTHDATVHPQSLNLSIDAFFSDLDETIWRKFLKGTIDGPLGTRWYLHIPYFLDVLSLGSALM